MNRLLKEGRGGRGGRGNEEEGGERVDGIEEGRDGRRKGREGERYGKEGMGVEERMDGKTGS